MATLSERSLAFSLIRRSVNGGLRGCIPIRNGKAWGLPDWTLQRVVRRRIDFDQAVGECETVGVARRPRVKLYDAILVEGMNLSDFGWPKQLAVSTAPSASKTQLSSALLPLVLSLDAAQVLVPGSKIAVCPSLALPIKNLPSASTAQGASPIWGQGVPSLLCGGSFGPRVGDRVVDLTSIGLIFGIDPAYV